MENKKTNGGVSRKDIIEKMYSLAKDYDLEGVEFTDEDAQVVEMNMNEGMELWTSIDMVMIGIREILFGE